MITIEQIQTKILEDQKWLLDISVKIKDSITKNDIADGPLSKWVIHILNGNKELLNAFSIQPEEKTCNAVLTLLEADSGYREPLMKMLIYRVLIYSHSAIDLKDHWEQNNSLEEIAKNLHPLVKLTDEYVSDNLETPTLANVCNSLEATGLKEYIAHFKETDIQIVLKALKAETNKNLADPKVNTLLDFLFKRLENNVQKKGAISSARHAWWALKDLLKLKSADWQRNMQVHLNGILDNLIRADVYVEDKGVNDIMANSNDYYERVWVLQNAIEILKLVKSYNSPITGEQTEKLNIFIREKIEEHFRKKPKNTLRNKQCNLVILYDILKNYKLIYADIEIEAGQEKAHQQNTLLDIKEVVEAINR